MNLFCFAAVGILAGALAFSGDLGLRGITPRDVRAPLLLEASKDSAPNSWIDPDDGDGELAVVTDDAGYDPDNPPKELEFHIISGPRQSTIFLGTHQAGGGHSQYLEDGSEPTLMWHHITSGPMKSNFVAAP